MCSSTLYQNIQYSINHQAPRCEDKKDSTKIANANKMGFMLLRTASLDDVKDTNVLVIDGNI